MAFNTSSASRLFLIVNFACSVGLLRAQVSAAALPLENPEAEQRITKLLGEMTLEEKIGQLVHRRGKGSNRQVVPWPISP